MFENSAKFFVARALNAHALSSRRYLQLSGAIYSFEELFMILR